MVRIAESQDVQIGLIVLLLDVIFIFMELFIEAGPTCRTMSQAVSCCAAHSSSRQLGDHFVVHDEENKLAHQMGHFAECPSPFLAAPASNGLSASTTIGPTLCTTG